MKACWYFACGGLAVGLALGALGALSFMHQGSVLKPTISSTQEFRPHGGRIYFYGDVHECALNLPSDHALTASQAIITNGGISPGADGNHVQDTRRSATGDSRLIPVDFLSITEGKDAPDPELQADDTIVVQQRVANF